MVEEEHAQSDSVRSRAPASADSWEVFAERFRPDASAEDPLVQRLLREIEPHHTVMDVGAGGGRLAGDKGAIKEELPHVHSLAR